jgi:2-polyprenyl-3-methyl-5-hydroxy-6-metoxy-1,4-benzoquinol methylase
MGKIKRLLSTFRKNPSAAIEDIRNYIEYRNPYSAFRKIANFDEQGIPERAFIRHIDRLAPEFHYYFVPYQWASGHIAEKVCLDAGCGMGSATHYLANYARHITGIDISQIAIQYATRHYSQKNCIFGVMDIKNLIYPDSSFDVVTSFEVLEHLHRDDQIRYIKEIARVLKPGGELFLSTPNKNLTKGANSYHICELEEVGLRELLSQFFVDIEILGITTDSRIIPDVNTCSILVGKCRKK